EITVDQVGGNGTLAFARGLDSVGGTGTENGVAGRHFHPRTHLYVVEKPSGRTRRIQVQKWGEGPERVERNCFRACYLSCGGRVLAIMPIRLVLSLLLAVAFALAQAPAVPDTPAGHALQAWLDVFNSGDRARIQDFVTKYDPADSVEETIDFREHTG